MPLDIVFLEPQNWRPLNPITKSLLPPSRKIGGNSATAFYPQKQGILLLKPRKSTKMTKMVGVTRQNDRLPNALF